MLEEARVAPRRATFPGCSDAAAVRNPRNAQQHAYCWALVFFQGSRRGTEEAADSIRIQAHVLAYAETCYKSERLLPARSLLLSCFGRKVARADGIYAPTRLSI